MWTNTLRQLLEKNVAFGIVGKSTDRKAWLNNPGSAMSKFRNNKDALYSELNAAKTDHVANEALRGTELVSRIYEYDSGVVPDSVSGSYLHYYRKDEEHTIFSVQHDIGDHVPCSEHCFWRQ